MAKQPILIIVCGGSGSGKTTVANEIKRLLPKKISCQIISMDTFYKPLDQKYGKDIYAKYNFDHPNAFDWELMKEKLFQLTSGKVTEIPVYDYCSSSRLNKVEKVKPTDIIIFEGILSLHDKDIANKAKIKIFIDTPSDERLIRRMMRDKVERKRTDEDIINQWKCITRKMHEIFVRPLKDDADIVIPWYKMNGVALEAIRSIVESLYKKNRNN